MITSRKWFIPGWNRGQAAGASGSLSPLVQGALAAGLVAGYLELAVVLVQRAIPVPITMASLRTNRHFVWMIPASNTLVLLFVGIMLAAVARYRPKLVARFAGRLLVGLAVLGPLLAVEGMYGISCIVAAIGFGMLFGPWIERRVVRNNGWSNALTRVLIASLLILGIADYAWIVSAEQRATASRPHAPPGAMNVVLIVMDNVRAESLSLLGYDRPTTPNLESLARGGIQFTEARSTAPWTLPSHASMFTGQWGSTLSVGWDRALDSRYPTLAEYLGGHGYATAGFVGNTYYCNARYGLDRGFARYDDFYENRVATPYEVLRSSALGKRLLTLTGHSVEVLPGEKSCRKTAAMLNQDALSWLSNRSPERPFFLFLNYFDAHSPFLPPEGASTRFGYSAEPAGAQAETLAKYRRYVLHEIDVKGAEKESLERTATDIFRDGYESCISYIDGEIQRLFESLDKQGLFENTLVIVTSDHGEHFREHGFFGHGFSLYRREVHVPLLIFAPHGVGGHRIVREPVSLRDLPSTVVDMLALDGRVPFPGRSLSRFWTSTGLAAQHDEDPLVCEVGHNRRYSESEELPATLGPMRSLTTRNKTYIQNRNGKEEIYHADDVMEQHNLIGEEPREFPISVYRSQLDRALSNTGPKPVERTAIGNPCPEKAAR